MSGDPHLEARTSSPDSDDSGSTLARGAGWIASATFVVGLVNYTFALIMTAALSVADFAVFGAGQALLLIAGTMAGASIPWLLASELVATPHDLEHRRAVVGFSTIANLALGALFGLGVGFIALRFASWSIALILVASTILIFAASTYIGWLQGDERFRIIAGVRVMEVSAKAAFGLAAVALGAGAGGALSGFAVGAGAAAVVGLWSMRSDLSVSVGALKTRRLLARAFSMGSIQLLVAVMASVGAVFVVLVPSTAADAASYQVAAILGRAPTFLAGALALVAFPLMSKSGGVRAPAFTERAVEIYLSVAIPFAIALATMPHEILGLVFPTYGSLDSVLPILAISGVLIGLIALMATSHQAAARFRGATQRLIVAVLLQSLGLAIGWSTGGVTGLAVGEAIALSIGAFAMVRWSVASIPLHFVPRPSSAAMWGLTLAVLIALRNRPELWFIAATLAGIAALYQGFRSR